MKQVLRFLWMLLIATSVYSGEPLRFEHLDTETGLSHNTVTGIFQDHQGYMWFGTIDGLNRYDGYRCLVFKHDADDPSSLPGNFIHGLLEDAQGNLWIGTRDDGLARLSTEDRLTGAFSRFQHEPENPRSLSHQLVQSLFVDRRGQLWVGTGAGLDLFLSDAEGFRHFRFHDDPKTVSGIVQESDDRLWVSTFDGLFLLDPGQPERKPRAFFHRPGDPTSLPANLVVSLLKGREGDYWVSLRGNGFVRFNADQGVVHHYFYDPHDPNGLPGNNAGVSFEDEEGHLWIGSDGQGLTIFDPDSGRFSNHRHQPMRTDSLSNDNVTHIYRSRDGSRGTLWVGTWGGGVNKLLENRQPIALVQHDPDDDNSPSSNFIFAISGDRFGDLWVGTIGAGLNRLHGSDGRWQRFIHDPNQPGSIGHNNIWHIYEDRSGELWICTERGGLNRLVRGSDGLSFTVAAGLPGDNIRLCYEDRSGFFWVAVSGFGLAYQAPGQAADTWHFLPMGGVDGLSDQHYQAVAEDRDGSLWFGSRKGGVDRIFRKDGAFVITSVAPDSLPNKDVRSVLVTDAGEVWVGTYGGGIGRYQGEQDSFEIFTSEDGLSNDFVYGMLEDDRGFLWISSNRGLSMLDPENRHFTHFSTRHGLQSDEFNSGAYYKAPDGELYFGGVNGLNHFYPDAVMASLNQERGQAAPVVLTQFSVMGEELPLQQVRSSQPLQLSYQDKFLTFEWSVLDYHDPAHNRFSYMLEGFDDVWIDNGNRNYARYTNLDPGSYRLRLKGSSASESWREADSVPLIITPPFWQTWWFRLALLAFAVLSVFIGLRIREFYQTWRGIKYVGHFKLLRKLGEGGSGTVYLARDRIGRRQLALKVLNNRMEEAPDGIRRFVQEAEIGGRLSHPNVVEIFEAGSQGKTRYIAMEYLAGQTLRQWLDQRGSLDDTLCHKLLVQLLDGLGAIHSHQIVHRDLKAANIMVLPGHKIKIMDFGLARLSTLTTVENREQLMGTLAYMSPEQTVGKRVDHHSDIYSLGVLLYEMKFGRLPFHAENQMELIFAIHNETPPGLDEQTPLCAIISKCMEKDWHDRYTSIQEIQEELSHLSTNAG